MPQHGVLMINVYPDSSYTYTQKAKVLSYTAELLSDMIIYSKQMSDAPIQIVSFGDKAQAMVNVSWGFLKSRVTGVSRMTVRNPVYISRRYGSPSDIAHPQPQASCRKLTAAYPRFKTPTLDSQAHLANYWTKYSADQLSEIRADKSLIPLLSSVASESISAPAAKFGDFVFRVEMASNSTEWRLE